MNNFVFYSPTEFVFGKDTEIQTGTLAKKYNARKAMIVYGGGSIHSQRITATHRRFSATGRSGLCKIRRRTT